VPDRIQRSEGRGLFGLDPDGYDAARPQYPEEIYSFLTDHGALGPNTATLEIGAGNGLATRRLLALGANPLTLVEPDPRFAPMLRELCASSPAECRLIEQPFEDADCGRQAYDLVAAATSFHWIDPARGLNKIASVLRPHGFIALWWHVFQDLDRDDPFHEATQAILADLAISPSNPPGEIPYALDKHARIRDLTDAGKFESIRYFETRWTLVLTPEEVGRLYLTYAHIQRLTAATRSRVIEALMEVAQTRFGGAVERNMTAPIYLAQRTR
jgi:SAM-dependent methyltransferase